MPCFCASLPIIRIVTILSVIGIISIVTIISVTNIISVVITVIHAGKRLVVGDGGRFHGEIVKIPLHPTRDIYHYIQHTRELTTYTHDQTDNNANSDDSIRADTTNTDVDASTMLQTAQTILLVGDGRRFHDEITKIPFVNIQF